MNGRRMASYLAIAVLAFALGWSGGSGSRVDAPQAARGEESGATSPEEAGRLLSEILEVEDVRARTKRLTEFFAATDPGFAPELRPLLVDPESERIRDETVEALFAHWWAGHDPAAAYREAVNPAWSERHPWMREVMRTWTRRDPSAAAAAVLDLPPGATNGRLEAARAVVDTWVSIEDMPDPTPLLQVIKHLEPIARGSALQHVISSMAEHRGIEETLDFVRSVEADGNRGLDRDVALEVPARAGIVLLEYDPGLAVAWAEEHKDGPAAVGIHKHLAYYWGLRDGQAAMEWAMALPPELRPMAVKRAWVSFGRKQKEVAREWLHARAPDVVLSGIYTQHLQILAEKEPQTALALAERSVDPATREQMLAAVLRGWMKSDPKAASAWLAESGRPASFAQPRGATTRPSRTPK
jgi:hypothetical protein